MKKNNWLKKIVLFIGLLGLLFIGHQYIGWPVSVKGDSMSPTLMDAQRLFILNKQELRHFDIIMFTSPDDQQQTYVKRVIGLPGDTISYQHDQLYINNKKVAEPYLRKYQQELADDRSFTEDIATVKVPANHYFVLGDNRRISKDSRTFGFVSKGAVTGQVKGVFWPLDQMKWFHNQ